MSIQTEIDRITANIAESYSVASDKGATLPEEQNSDNLAETLRSITVGGAAGEPKEKDVNFYDYDGTRLYSYTLAEAQALTELPPLPTQPGLICQGWNWDLEDIKALGREVDVGATYITCDDMTKIYVELDEETLTPILGIGLYGSATVDWGDGTQTENINGNSVNTVVYTNPHNYNASGNYVISIFVHQNGNASFQGMAAIKTGSSIFRFSQNDDGRNYRYLGSVKKIMIGKGFSKIENYAFNFCQELEYICLPQNITKIGAYAFNKNTKLKFLCFPQTLSIVEYAAFQSCRHLKKICISNMTFVLNVAMFRDCCTLESVFLPDKTTITGDTSFRSMSALTRQTLPKNVDTITNEMFSYSECLREVELLGSIKKIGDKAFLENISLLHFESHGDIKSIGDSAFNNCYSVKYYDFSMCTVVPTLTNVNAFTSIPVDCEIRVPAALYDEWINATNWSTYASQIVAV